VKLDEFGELCRREHEENGGDVTALSLTNLSHWELHSSYHASRGILCSLGPLVPRLPNPATGTEVTIEGGGACDTATTVRGTEAHSLALGPGCPF